MSLTSDNMSAADYAVLTGNHNNGGFDNDMWILILFFCLFGNNGWNGNGNGNGYNGGGGGYAPYVVSDVQRGFDQNAVMNGLGNVQNAVTSGFGDVQLGIAGVNQNICQTSNGIMGAVSNGFSQAEISANARQMADMNQRFGMQTAMNQGFNQLGSQFADCCCENRMGIADLKYTVATENCADRTQSMQNTRDILENQNRNTQAVIDKLCALELDGVKGQLAQAQRDNTALQNQLNMANMQASQAAQTATFQQGLNNEVDALYNRLNSCPIPTTPVYGRTPIFTCQNQGCGCGQNFVG